MKLKRIEADGKLYGYSFVCPACNHPHVYTVPAWNFNGDMECPTFTPSLLNRWKWPDELEHICHLNLTKGILNFGKDCTHYLKGQAIPLPEYEWGDE